MSHCSGIVDRLIHPTFFLFFFFLQFNNYRFIGSCKNCTQSPVNPSLRCHLMVTSYSITILQFQSQEIHIAMILLTKSLILFGFHMNSVCVCVCVCVQLYAIRSMYRFMHACMLSCFSHVRLCATPWTETHQAPLSTGFSRQEYWSGLPFTSPTDLCNESINTELFRHHEELSHLCLYNYFPWQILIY